MLAVRAAVFSLLLLVACAGPEPRAQLLIWVRADDVVAAQLAQVRVSLSGESAIKREARFEISHGSKREGELQLPFSFGVAFGPTYAVNLVVRGYASREDDAPVIVTASTMAFFKPRVTQELTVHLGTRNLVCRDATLPGCSRREDAGPQPLPPSDAGWDAHPDTDDDASPPPEVCVRGAGADVCDPVNQCGCDGAAEC